MRRFKLQVQMSVDGYMAGPNGEMDWLTCPWTDDINAYLDALTEPVDRIVLGRKLAEGFIPAWAAGPEGEDQASIDKMNNTPKVVISDSLAESPWENATVMGGDLTKIVAELTSGPGGDLITYGGATLAQRLIAANLLDELHLLVNPVALGSGLPVFADTGAHQKLHLVAARQFDCGITALHLEPKRP
ncbi:dihydrofolate reductase [Streptomyces sp. WAC05374]|uniref:dihydrofolate reductase family protein n=1 Tax=Streptomyces sp. WAC05374 TaxID=2487420 RepID=UPI000F863060|nr:dihydrofolate reductase family protein [Streptomyces sp. WAC05374]RST08602.1 dihydrofolate reductase [Streptomyces sp. WAC05374]TDF47020.1 dihydrofolate reductase [Streptomyces sp. WAC05374]TDF57276.1 dihydrofolate reductase [Streptomyces sp. WAC05374]TDF61380.1 dihydrofolate reductase [Streptomyces sp. WAC05374]